jgi:CHASE2 domain-containing sensor protein
LWQRFRGKLVLIGDVLKDKHSIYEGEQRFGVHILADGINTILQGQYIYYVGAFHHIWILLVVSLMAAWLRLRISPDRKKLGRGLLLALSLLYLAVAIFLYIHLFILLKVAYHLVALVLVYWSVGLLRKRFA